MHGATDAAKNAADLILTEPGLSPIYGAVLESRRIFARIKAYVVYRIAASFILVFTLSTVVFTSGCAVDSLLVIILALLNDVSMIPVAYDRAQATTKPQIPNTTKLVAQSLFYGVVHTGLALMFIYTLNHAGKMDLDLTQECSSETRGFVWFYLVLVTELAILSVRAPSFFWTSVPSLSLLMSVLVTCVLGAFIAVYASDLSVEVMGYIVLYNLAAFLVVDLLKVPFRNIIKEDPGAPIESDDLLEPPKKLNQSTEASEFMKKQLRYHVHRESRVQPSDLEHIVEIRPSHSILQSFFHLGEPCLPWTSQSRRSGKVATRQG